MRIKAEALEIPKRALSELGAIPFSLTMILLTLALGLASGASAERVVTVFSTGFGASLGEIVLILLPSFVLASAITQSGVRASASGLANAMSPFAGAAMVCPDTAYAALAPVSGRRKLSTLFGVYAGFKLLVPAGPALVAAILGGLSAELVLWGALICLPCWGVGVAYARYHENVGKDEGGASQSMPLSVLAPFATLLAVMGVGVGAGALNLELPGLIAYAVDPKGALMAAAVCGLAFLKAEGRSEAIERGVKRTTPLLLMIGAAGALGAMMAEALPFAQLASYLAASGLAVPALFVLAALLKLSKGSSMATFAGAGGIVAALLPGLGLSVEAATLALCAGAFVAIAPNDSLFWLVREDAFGPNEAGKATRILAFGTTLQGLVALSFVQLAVWSGLL